MFRCEFSGELSDGAVWQIVDEVSENTKHKVRVRKLIKPAEKPVLIVVETRKKLYEKPYVAPRYSRGRKEEVGEANISEGFEIVREIRVREKYAEKVRLMVAEGTKIPRKATKRLK